MALKRIVKDFIQCSSYHNIKAAVSPSGSFRLSSCLLVESTSCFLLFMESTWMQSTFLIPQRQKNGCFISSSRITSHSEPSKSSSCSIFVRRGELGATSLEEAVGWIRSFKEAALKECSNQGVVGVACSKRKWKYFRLDNSKRTSLVDSFDFCEGVEQNSFCFRDEGCVLGLKEEFLH